jgi:hypothetical protein
MDDAQMFEFDLNVRTLTRSLLLSASQAVCY